MSLGLLVDGDNHLILRGPRPSPEEAQALARHFGLSLAQIAPRLDRSGLFAAWRISTREFRENLTWASLLPSPTPHSEAVCQLLKELSARGIPIDLVQETPCVISF